jgi:hypothetical protein
MPMPATIVERAAMTAALEPLSILRTAAGEPPLGRNAESVTDNQGEVFDHDNPCYRSMLARGPATSQELR